MNIVKKQRLPNFEILRVNERLTALTTAVEQYVKKRL